MPELCEQRSLEYYLLELVLNSIKSKATAIAVRIRDRRIQVVDNGSGISKNALRYVGEYSAEREGSGALTKKESIMKEGSLIKIRGHSSCLIIMSRSQFSTETYGKCFRNGKALKVQRIENRPSSGSTVTVCVSSELCNWNKEIDSFAVKFIIVYLSLMNKQVSFSVRDDTRGSILLRMGRNQRSKHLLRVIFQQPVKLGQVHCIKTQILGKMTISGFWGFNCTGSRRIQQVLLNLRPVHCPLLQKFMIRTLSKICYPCTDNANLSLEQIFFLVYIECLDSEYNISLSDAKLTVDFYHIDKILDFIRKSLGKSMKEFESSNPQKPSKVLKAPARRLVVPPVACHPKRQILGVKHKGSILIEAHRHRFQRAMVITDIKKSAETSSEIKKSTRFGSGNSNDTSCDTNNVPSLSEESSPGDSVSAKEHEYKDPQVLRTNQDCVAKRDDNKIKPLLNSSTTSRNTSVFVNSDKCRTRRISIGSEKCVQQPQHDGSKLRQSGNRIASVRSMYRDSVSNVSEVDQKLIEKSHDTDELRNTSQYFRSDYSNAVEGNYKRQRSIEESQKCTDDPVQKSGDKIPNESLSTLKKYQYNNRGVLWISKKCNEKLLSRIEETYDIDCSQWSNWTYESNTSIGKKHCGAARPVIYKRFKFLPLNLHALLPFLHERLIDRDLSEDVGAPVNLNLNRRHQDHGVRPCMRHSMEIRLKIESLKAMKVLNQVNREFILALTKQDGKKLVIVVDQHAMHERIRYENLLRAYRRDQKNQQYLSVTLHHPIIISDFPRTTCNLLSVNMALLTRYGLKLTFRNETTLLIFAVPRCFLKKTFRTNNTEVEIAVRKLLQEMVDKFITHETQRILPFTIHDAIASEACHGAIKFGDPLTLKQCESLVSCWKETDAPNRCAHGRPSVVPLLELSSQRTNHYELVCQGKLNFASLRKNWKDAHYEIPPVRQIARNHQSEFHCDDDGFALTHCSVAQ